MKGDAGLERPKLTHRLAILVGLSTAGPLLVVSMAALVTYVDVVDRGLALLVIAWLVCVIGLSLWVGYATAAAVLRPITDLGAALRRIDASQGLDEASVPELDKGDSHETAAIKGALRVAVRRVSAEKTSRELALSGLVHDLKTPVVGQGLILAELGRIGSANFHELLWEAQVANADVQKRLDRIIAALRADISTGVARGDPYAVSELVDELVSTLRPSLQVHKIQIQTKGEATTTADRTHVWQAAENVLLNAMRYAVSRISIELTPGLIRVVDDGPGFGDDFTVLTYPFETRAGHKREGGTAGLGLYIARRSLEQVGGSLKLEASRPGFTAVLLYLGERRSP